MKKGQAFLARRGVVPDASDAGICRLAYLPARLFAVVLAAGFASIVSSWAARGFSPGLGFLCTAYLKCFYTGSD